MSLARRTIIAYWGVVVLFSLVLGWWLVFFSRQGSMMIQRLERSGAELNAVQAAMVRDLSDRSTRMLLFEGGFLVLLLFAGVLIVLSSMRREVLLARQQKDFLSAVTHELRSPIASALLHIESLKLDRVPQEKRARYLDNVHEDLKRLSELVNRLLATARATTGRVELVLERFDLGEFVERTMNRLTQDEGDRVDVSLDLPRGIQVDADGDALETILRNLYGNALKYGGNPARVRVDVRRENGAARISVRDWGPGVGQQIGKLFDPFVRGANEIVESRPGVGLGLYLVAELTRSLGGDVRARNPEDGGFAVEVTLPLATGEVA